MKIHGPWAFIKQLRRIIFLVFAILIWQTRASWSSFFSDLVFLQLWVIVATTCLVIIIKNGFAALYHDSTGSCLIMLLCVNLLHYFSIMANWPTIFTNPLAVVVVLINGMGSGYIGDEWFAWHDGE
jgi:hypothetical protein